MYFSTTKRDTANTWEVDTPVKPPDVLFSIFLGSVTHDQILKVLASRNRLDPPLGFALIIPPGHCPIPKGPTGLCFRKCGHCSSLCPTFTWAKGVFIIDFDAHHGNGTNDAFYDDPDIFIISTHQDGSYPVLVKLIRKVMEMVTEQKLNLPILGGSDDIAMTTVLDEIIVPCAQRFKIKADIILVSAGFALFGWQK
ncbi:histone deacetylase 14, chloroplastic-like isoform X2 [Quercus robur]|uniref:histone deacetylase 14, chloroplastic-like isoform X2 n=1 Tax=Quercus robur TaxID=38942 RepID=UPI0021612CEF|nr:histone deacetylase 14, chloroplastic-like isoform X2 [Quercus robur]XP_050257258.1 histone deacetylase 14, chloroplastic-like isoform X2 [Quercus robur]